MAELLVSETSRISDGGDLRFPDHFLTRAPNKLKLSESALARFEGVSLVAFLTLTETIRRCSFVPSLSDTFFGDPIYEMAKRFAQELLH